MKNIHRYHSIHILALIIVGFTTARLSAVSNDTLLAKFDFESPDQLVGWASESAGADRPLKEVIPGLQVDYDTTTAHSGDASLRLELTPEMENFNYVYTRGIITPQADEPHRLRLTAYVKTQGPTGNAFISILEHGPESKVLQWGGGQQKLIPLPESKDWEKVQIEVPLNPQTVVIVIMIHFEEGTLWLDDLSVEMLTDDTGAAAKKTDTSQAAVALPSLPPPTLADVPYGSSPKQILHFWKAESDTPTPLVFYIHGGGWEAGDRMQVSGILPELLKAGISVVSVEYRFAYEAARAGVMPPVQWPMQDVARALQFVRSKASEWNINKARIGASGASAGGCSSLWLAFHKDMADANSSDPVARESTRPWCVAAQAPQTTLDPQQMKEWTPNSTYGGHAFKVLKQANGKDQTDFDAFLAQRESILPWIAEYSPYALAAAGAPPICMIYAAPPALGQAQQDPTHTANFGVKLQEKLRGLGVDCELVYPGAPDVKHPTMQAYLIERLKSA